MKKDTITITNNRNNKTYEFNILDASVGPSVVDISTFYKETGMFTFDNGYTSTASCESKITYIDGEAGRLSYRGYDISYMANKKSFLDTAYLLLYNELPNKSQLEDFTLEMKKRSFVNEGIKKAL
jgi:citrate synthase